MSQKRKSALVGVEAAGHGLTTPDQHAKTTLQSGPVVDGMKKVVFMKMEKYRQCTRFDHPEESMHSTCRNMQLTDEAVEASLLLSKTEVILPAIGSRLQKRSNVLHT